MSRIWRCDEKSDRIVGEKRNACILTDIYGWSMRVPPVVGGGMEINMKYEMKICLPVYKIVYSLCFVIALSLVRGITDVAEIGITLDAFMAVLASIFCADTLQMEYTGKRWEVFCLYPVKYRLCAMGKRMVIQCLYLWLLSAFGYICFFWQQPRNLSGVSESLFFGMTFAAVAVSVVFFGMMAFILANFCRSSLAGIGISIVLWLILYSAWGERVLGRVNVFAFIFRNTENVTDIGWILGKGVAVLLVVFMVLLHVVVTKKSVSRISKMSKYVI